MISEIIRSAKMEQPKLNNNSADYLTAAAKGVASCVPCLGGLVAEVLGTVIPRQRVDRIVDYLHILEQRLESLEQNLARDRLSSTEGTALLEDSLLSAYRTQSEARRQHIANIVITGICGKTMHVSEAQRLISILDELNDSEVVVLQAYALRWFSGRRFFRENHRLLFPEAPVLTDPQNLRDDYAIRKSYDKHLEQLGLVASELTIEATRGGKSKMVRGKAEITDLGLVLVRSFGGETLG